MGLLHDNIRLVLDDVKYVQNEYRGIRTIQQDRGLWDTLKNTISNMDLLCLQRQCELAFHDLIESVKDRDMRVEYLAHFRSSLETLFRCADYVAPFPGNEESDHLLMNQEIFHSLDISAQESFIPHLQAMVFGECAATHGQIEELFHQREIVGTLVKCEEKILGYALFEPDNESEITTIKDCASQGENAAEMLACSLLMRVSCNNGALFPRHKRLEECIEQWHESLQEQD